MLYLSLTRCMSFFIFLPYLFPAATKVWRDWGRGRGGGAVYIYKETPLPKGRSRTNGNCNGGITVNDNNFRLLGSNRRNTLLFFVCVCIYVYVCVWEVLDKSIAYTSLSLSAWITREFKVICCLLFRLLLDRRLGRIRRINMMAAQHGRLKTALIASIVIVYCVSNNNILLYAHSPT